MGLDMYLRAKRLFNKYDEKDKELSRNIRTSLGLSDLDLEVDEIKVEAAYWRKDNAIHGWFVEQCQNGVDECQESEVTRTQLRELIALCKKVLENPTQAEDLMATRDGFFFGNTDYDEDYFNGLRDTIEQLEKALKLPSDWYFVYQSSW